MKRMRKCVNDAAQGNISFAATVTLVRPYIMTQTENPVILEMGVKSVRIYMALGLLGQLVEEFERMLSIHRKTIV